MAVNMASLPKMTLARAAQDEVANKATLNRLYGRDAIHRRGLNESLQEFAHRIGGPSADVDSFRTSWALQGLRFVGAVPLDVPWTDLVPLIGNGARLAPGIPVPTLAVRL